MPGRAAVVEGDEMAIADVFAGGSLQLGSASAQQHAWDYPMCPQADTGSSIARSLTFLFSEEAHQRHPMHSVSTADILPLLCVHMFWVAAMPMQQRELELAGGWPSQWAQ